MSTPAQTLPIVDGETRLFGILGDPIAQVKSPQEITARFRAAGRNALCLPLHARPADFDAVLRGLKAMPNFDGFVLTVPHKVRAMAHVDHLSPMAVRVGAVNVARRQKDGSWVGEMYDGQGLVGAVRQTGFDPKGKRAIVLGAGGAGSAIIDALAAMGAASITIFDLDQAKANDVATRLGKAHAGCKFSVGPANPDGQDLLVNATPIGMGQGDGMPAPFGKFPSSLVVADVITKPEISPLLAHARACGCRFSTGVQMFKAQADMIAGYLIPEIANGR